MSDFRQNLPVKDIQIGRRSHIRVYGDGLLEPPLIEMREMGHGDERVTNLTLDQANDLVAALLMAIVKARFESGARE